MLAAHAVAPLLLTLTRTADMSSVAGRFSSNNEVPAMARHRLAVAVGLMSAGLAGLAALAQDARNYPSRNVHVIVANAAGGGTDYLARIIGQKMQERMGQSVVIENKP